MSACIVTRAGLAVAHFGPCCKKLRRRHMSRDRVPVQTIPHKLQHVALKIGRTVSMPFH